MSANFKGRQSATLVSEEPAFNAETGVQEFDQTFAGSKAAIFGLAASLKDDNISFRITNAGPVYTLVARVPQIDPAQENLDRYEIFTESQEKSIFEHPLVLAESVPYDTANIGSSADTWRKKAEDAVASADTDISTTFGKVVRHLRGGVTGFQSDFLTLRRFRQIDITYGYGAAGKFSLSAGNLIYTTAQLNLPAAVAFTIPANPTAPSADFEWGWKLRGQRVEITGGYVEQTVELVFAPWSTLLYEAAGGNLSW